MRGIEGKTVSGVVGMADWGGAKVSNKKPGEMGEEVWFILESCDVRPTWWEDRRMERD